MSLFEKHLENLFGSVAALTGAIMVQAAFYAASQQLGDFMFPLNALLLTGLIVTACRVSSDRGTAIFVAGIMSVLMNGIFVGFSGKIRNIFFDVANPFPFQLGWTDVFMVIVAPYCIAAIALTWRFYHENGDEVQADDEFAQG